MEQALLAHLPPWCLFWREEPSAWPLLHVLAFALLVLLALEGVAALVSVVLDCASAPSARAPPGGRLIHRRDCADFTSIYTNKLCTVAFLLHLLRDLWFARPPPPPSLLSVAAPIPLLFLAYDAIYSPFHYFLHWAPVYAYIHKHHHRQVAPHRGLEDAVNTHPLEYASGMWMHLLALWLLRDACGLPISPWAVLLFVAGGSLLAAVNHSRVEVAVPFLFNSLEHDTHHRFSAHNYAQYTQAWDWLAGTYREWSAPPPLAPRATPAPPLPCAPAPSRDAPRRCLVTGGSGLVGARLVSMLVERGAESVVSVDLALPPPSAAAAPPGVRHVACDIAAPSALAQLTALCQGMDAVFHCAALVGPGFPAAAYRAVNVGGSAAVTAAAAAARVPVLVLTSSPTILLRGQSVRNASEASLPAPRTPSEHLHEYSRTKAEGTWEGLAAARAAGVRACAIAPHQVYGAHDRLFLPALLASAAAGSLRIFGPGDNLISLCHVDNCAHAHILAARALAAGAGGVEGELFVITDTGAVYLWDAISDACQACGLGSLHDKAHLSTPTLYAAAYTASAASALGAALLGTKPLLFNPFAVRMLLIDRWFDVGKAVQRLGYRPLVAFEAAWPRTVRAVWQRTQGGRSASSAGVGNAPERVEKTRKRGSSSSSSRKKV